MGRPAISQAQKESIDRMKDQYSAEAIAQQIGCSSTYVRNYLKATGQKLKHAWVTPEEKEEIIRLGHFMDIASVAKRVGRSYAVVCKVLRVAGVKPRKPLRPKRVNADFCMTVERDGEKPIRVEETPKPPKTLGEPWTPEEDKLVLDADNFFTVADVLNRDFEAVKERYRELSPPPVDDLTLDNPPVEQSGEWTDEELDLIHSDVDPLIVAKRLGVTFPYAVALRRGQVCQCCGHMI